MSAELIPFNIHIIGDSHTRLYSSKNLKHYKFNVHYIQNINIKDFYQQNTTIEDLMENNDTTFRAYLQGAKPQYKHMPIPSKDINKNDIIIFVMGEIDIRNNLKSELNQENDLNKILENWVYNYIECIKMNIERHPGVKFGLQSVLPTTDTKNYGSSIPIEWHPTIDIEIRKKGTSELNKLLKQKCIENDLLFIDITEYYINDESDYPRPGLDVNAGLNELDTRIKDDASHVNIDYPDGIEFVLEKMGIPYNNNNNNNNTENFENYLWINLFNIFILILLLLLLLLLITRYSFNKSLLKFFRIKR